MNIIYLLIAALIGYLCGAIPFGYIYVKIVTGKDIRTIGSGRTGGTNSLRAAGVGVGALTSISDVFKGAAAVWLIRWLLGGVLETGWLPWAILCTGVMAVVGHNWSVFMGWRGGAGTAPNVGWATAVWWPMFPIGFVVMVGMLLIIGMASVASLSMGAIIPIVFAIRYFMGLDTTLVYTFAGLLAFLVIAWALRPNLKRLRDGTERVVGPRARRAKKKRD